MTKTLRSAALLIALLGALPVVGCAGAPASPSPGDSLTQITLALMTVPTDVQCIEVTVTGATTVTRRFDVTPPDRQEDATNCRANG
jgi:hypothetical protein